MRHVHRLAAGVGLAALGCGGSGGTDPGTTPPPGSAPEVFTPGSVFSPFSLSVAVGDSVRFNISASHNVIFRSVAGAPANINVVTDAVVVRRFTARGTFPYDCTVHPGMSGEIVVK
jgi:plastocyanin